MDHLNIQVMTIDPRHREEWQASRVDEEIIERNVATLTDPREVDELLNRNSDKRWKHSTDLAPGWVVTGVEPKTGERTFKGAQFKPDRPPKDPDSGKFVKYLSPSGQLLTPLFLETSDPEYWRKLITDITTPIILTEGAKKAGAALSQGLPCISVPGVATGGKKGRLRPELELYCHYGRKIYLAFDRDIVSKLQVARALHNLGRMLAAKGAMVYVLEWPILFKGLDEFIASGGDVRQRMHQAPTLEEWKEDQEEAQPVDGEKCALARRLDLVEQHLKGRLRWNALKSQIELDGETIELESLRIQLAIKHNIGLPSEDCNQIAIYLAKKETFSPVAEYLKQCSKLYPADSDLLDSLTETYFGAVEPLHRVFLRKTLIAAVARACLPGCKVDTVCIISGGQGVGKSTFWKILAGEEWFDDTVGSASDKDERLKLHQAWFIEWAELESVFKRKDISAVKAFITTQSDQVRPPYGRSVQEFRRPSIIVGSTNETEFLADPTGNRRYWVIPVVAPFIPLEQLAGDRDRIWAAAFHAFQSGEGWDLPPEFRQVAKLDSLNYTFSDPWETAVLDYCDDKQKVITVEILVNALHIDIETMDKRSEMRVTSILKNAGWISSRQTIQGRKVRFWTPPPCLPLDLDQPLEGGVGPYVDFENSDFSKFTQIGWSRLVQGKNEGSENQSQQELEYPDQPLDQPPDQPRTNPPIFEQNTITDQGENSARADRTNLDRPFSRSSRTIGATYQKDCFGVGSIVLVNASAIWFKTGSDKLPWQEVPPSEKGKPEIAIQTLSSVLFQELLGESRVISLSKDGSRVKVRQQTTGRNSVFRLEDVQILKGGDDNG